MDRGQDTGGSGDTGDISYGERGADNIEDLTRYDENLMDRAAQAGVEGAFGAGNEQSPSREDLRADAEAAFSATGGGGTDGGAAGGDASGGSAGDADSSAISGQS